MTCKRCGDFTPRFTLRQRYCQRCEREVEARIALDTKRRTPRFPWARDTTQLVLG